MMNDFARIAGRLGFCVALAIGACFVGAEPATRPSTAPAATQPAMPPLGDRSVRGREIRATIAMNNGDYATALKILERLAVELRNDPERLGPIMERIRVCQAQLQQTNTGAAVNEGPRKEHAAPKPGEALALTIRELGNFEFDPEKGGNIPKDVMLLNGATVQLRGFMLPLDQAEAITNFALVPSLFACCFGQPPGVQHTIIVKCPEGRAVRYYPDEVLVTGTLSVEEKREDGYIISIFEMVPSSVKPAPQEQ